MNYSEAEEYAQAYGDAFYVYDEGRFVANYHALLSAFVQHYSNVQVAYSYKTNYTPAICRRVDELGGYAEVVSAMEYALARRLGVKPDKIVYNGPWKSDESVREALLAGSIVNLDSERDLRMVVRVAEEEPATRMRVGIRCNFKLEGYPDSRFGFDVEGQSFHQAVATIQRLGNVTLSGLHCHFPDRELGSFLGRAQGIANVAQRVFKGAPEFISIGGGFFGHMPESLRSKYSGDIPSFADYGRVVGEVFTDTFGSGSSIPLLFIEPGTALVADTFQFITRVVDVKTIRGRTLACVAGSLFNVSPYARSRKLPLTVLRRDHDASSHSTSHVYDIVGYTCIEGDVLAERVTGDVSVDDFVVFSNVGSYSIVMKPPFILPSVPIVMRSMDGRVKVIKQAESFDYIFQNFIA